MLFVMTAEYLGEPDGEMLAAHVAWLVPRFASGDFLVSGGVPADAGRPVGALAVIEAADREAALAMLDDEPFHRAGLVRHDVVPFVPRVRAEGLDVRFTGPELLRVVRSEGEP